MKILDATVNKALLNAVVEVETKCKTGSKGNVELKVHAPGKKGATLELRKLSDFDYKHVEELKNVLTTLIDAFIDGDSVEQATMDKTIGRITSKPKLFTCDICGFQSKFSSALKAHKTRIHSFICSVCDFKADSQAALKGHTLVLHKNKGIVKPDILCGKCQSTFQSQLELNEHEKDNIQN